MHIYVVENSLTIYEGLAFEQVLFHMATTPVLVFWQSQAAVVIGRNQNPWIECNLSLMYEEGVALARRDSGGGTVYHDAENMNICVVTKSRASQVDRNLQCFKELLSSLARPVERTVHHDLLFHAKKVSGSAMRYAQGKLLHHFTLLLHPDAERITRMLNAPQTQRIDSRAVPSRRTPVGGVGLSYSAVVEEFLEHKRYAESLQEQSAHKLRVQRIADLLSFIQQENLTEPFAAQKQRLCGDAWLYGNTPEFTVHMEEKMAGEQPIPSCKLRFVRGRLSEIVCDDREVLCGELGGKPLSMSPRSMKEYIESEKKGILKELLKSVFHMYYKNRGGINREYTH